MSEFMNAAADWADRTGSDVKFARDEYEGWFALICMTDSRGPFSAMVNAVAPRPRSRTAPRETPSEFNARVGQLLSREVARARAKRIEVNTGRSVAARAA